MSNFRLVCDFKFLLQGRKFVPNDTYEDHKVSCIQVATSPTQQSEHNESVFSDQFSGGDCSEGHRDPMEDEMGQPSHGESTQSPELFQRPSRHSRTCNI